MKQLLKVVSFAVLTLVLTGCQTPLHRAINNGIQLGIENSDDMRYRNIAMVVHRDEGFFEDYPLDTQTVIYMLGAGGKNEVETRHRIVHLSFRNSSRVLYKRTGSIVTPMAALVPDHVPRLRAGDVVEVRQRGTFNVIKDFFEKGEGNTVVQVLCQINKPDFGRCMMTKTPTVAEFMGYGPTKTYYPENLKEHGFSFTPMYDMQGKALRTLHD